CRLHFYWHWGWDCGFAKLTVFLIMMYINKINDGGTAHDERPWYKWLVCLCASLFFFYEFIQMNMFNAISAQLMQAFHINAAQLGRLSAFYFIANVVFLFPAGMLLDRYSARKIILTSLAICVLGTALFASTSSVFFASFFRFMMGIGSAFCFLSV